MNTTPLQQHRPHALFCKKLMLASALTLVMGPAFAAALSISPLQGTMETAQWSYAEWFSRYSATLDATTLAAFRNSPGNASGLDLFASDSSVKVTFLGTGATRNANLFLAYEGSSNFNSASFWNPVYASGGSNINLPNTNYFFSGSTQNNSDARGWADGQFHAKVLKLANNDYLVGFEDTWLGTGSSSDRDFNDLVFRFQGVSVTSPIPEPSNALLLLPGLAWMVAVFRRRAAAASA